MPPVQQLPYFTSHLERVTVDSWQLQLGGTLEPMPAFLPNWDPGVTLSTSTSITADVPGIFEDCALGPDARLRAGLRWYSPGTGLRGTGSHVDLALTDGTLTSLLSAEIEGTQLASSLELAVCLILLQPGLNPGPFTARRPGTLLYLQEPRQRLLLEGEGGRFPVELIDFSIGRTVLPDNAGWVLVWDPEDLHQPVLGSVRLYVNSRHERVKQAVTLGLPEDFGISEAIRYDLARTLILGALQNDEFVNRPEAFAEDTVGAAIHAMLHVYFDGVPLHDLRSNAEQPSSFEPKLQAALKVFWGE
ncbi:MAG: hypothetical protein IT318_14865 [Anaerolineales bacterium]|nr:hypothetical protein [Anaerolineales bacterium]